MAKLIMLSGLPASGKSTRAKEILKESGNYVRLNKDLLRTMLHFDKFNFKKEKITKQTERMLAQLLLERGQNVVIDDTNMGSRYEDSWKGLADEAGAKFEKIVLDTPIEECIERDKTREKKVGRDVIVNMARRMGMDEAFGEKEILVDLDGTLAKIDHRLHHVRKQPKDWMGFFKDIPNDVFRQDVWDVVQNLAKKENAKIVILTARPEDLCKQASIEWLEKNGVDYHTILMRQTGDHRIDEDVKRDLLESHFRKDRIVTYFDDRPRVIKMLMEELGPERVTDVGSNKYFVEEREELNYWSEN